MASKKIKMIIIYMLVVTVLVILGGIGVVTYRNWKTETIITEYQMRIEKIAKSFSDSTERADKLEILKNLIDEANKYNDLEKPIKEVKQEYKQEIQSMRTCFVERYDAEIEQNTLSDVATITDKEALNNAKTNLSALLETMESEFELTLSEAEHTEYVAKINSLVEGYTNRVAEIEKEEEEARLKAEEEARLKAEAEAKAKEEAKKKVEKSGGTSNNTNANANNQSSSGRRDINTLYHQWQCDPTTGEKIEGTDIWFDVYTGDIYDENGYPTGESFSDWGYNSEYVQEQWGKN